MATILKKIKQGKHSWQPERWLVSNEDGRGIIKWKHDSVPSYLSKTPDSYLFFNGVLFAGMEQVCPTCSGILHTGYSDRSSIEKWLKNIRETTQDVKQFNEETLEHFFPIFELFNPGVYSYGIVEYSSKDGYNGSFFLELFGGRSSPNGLPWGNGQYGPRYLFPTQGKELIDEKVVEDYIHKIEKGARPFGIAHYLDGFLSLLLDGHHKATAYHRLGMEIPCLTFQRINPYVNREDGFFYSLGEEKDFPITKLPKKLQKYEKGLFDNSQFLKNCITNEEAEEYCKKLGIETDRDSTG